jgi:protein-S-isoprenylcysteine O-methyltransferase Ste14
MFPPLFPIYVPALIPLHPFATLVWLAGVICLWLTRYTHQLGRRLGVSYYLFSAVVRPLGILLIALGWLALYAPQAPPFLAQQLGWLPRGDWMDILLWLGILAFFGLGVWSVAGLGIRRSFFFRRLDDSLVTHGPYGLVRHPQFLSAIGITFFGIQLFNPAEFFYTGYGSLGTNWILFTCALWTLSILEDRELAAHFGSQYEEYAGRVPRLFPN